jgi:uncharacterized membrane protein
MLFKKEKIETGDIRLNANESKTGIKIILSILVVFFIISGIAGIGFTQKNRDFKNYGPWPFIIDKIIADLNLSDDQKAKVQKIKDEIKAKMDIKKKDKKEGMSDFENAFKQDKLDKETLETIFKKHEADKEEMRSFFEDEIIKFHDILTFEQRSKVAEKMKDFKGKNGKHNPDSQ